MRSILSIRSKLTTRLLLSIPMVAPSRESSVSTGTRSEPDAALICWSTCGATAFASPFYQGELPEGLLHPNRIRDGVHWGVIDGGNQSGIPYGRGWELFDNRYLGKPLVFCGTVGALARHHRLQAW